MPKKKHESLLGLPPLPPQANLYTTTGLIPYTGERARSRSEIQILEVVQEQKVMIGAYTDKSKFGLEQMNEMKWFAVSDVWYTMQQIEEVKLEAMGTSSHAAMEEFSTYLVNLSARHTLGVVEVSASKIAEIIGASVLPPPPPAPAPEPRKGLLARILGV